jgi:hypothetical protein
MNEGKRCLDGDENVVSDMVSPLYWFFFYDSGTQIVCDTDQSKHIMTVQSDTTLRKKSTNQIRRYRWILRHFQKKDNCRYCTDASNPRYRIDSTDTRRLTDARYRTHRRNLADGSPDLLRAATQTSPERKHILGVNRMERIQESRLTILERWHSPYERRSELIFGSMVAYEIELSDWFLFLCSHWCMSDRLKYSYSFRLWTAW